MFARLACSIGNDSFNGSWCMTFNPEVQRNDSNCPSPTTAPRRRLHRAYQVFLHGLLLDTFQDLCPAVTAGHTSTAKYDDPAFQDDDGYPYCIGTELLKALHHYYVPTDDQTSMNVQQTFEKQLQSFIGAGSADSGSNQRSQRQR
jgi:hypothetical protein